MSVSKWAYEAWKCEGEFCIGDCNLCYKAQIEQDGDVTFLHKVKKGAVDKSYGIHVAKLAGMPKDLLKRASEVLKMYESNDKEVITTGSTQVAFNFDVVEEDNPVLDRLDEIDPLKVTPMDAINLLYELKELSKK